MERAYRQSTRALAVMQLVIGIALVVMALSLGGGPLAVGVIAGVAIAVLGAARLYLARGRSGGNRRA